MIDNKVHGYSKVSRCDDVFVDEDGQEDTTNGEEEEATNDIVACNFPTAATAPPASGRPSSSWKIPVLFFLVVLIAFFIGFLVGNNHYLNNTDDIGQGCSSDATTQQVSAVSYNFLQTPKGKELQTTLHHMLNYDGPIVTLQYMADLMEQDSQILSSCHPFLHTLGRKELTRWRRSSLAVDEEYAATSKINATTTINNRAALKGAVTEVLTGGKAELIGICNAAYLHGLIEDSLKMQQQPQQQEQQQQSYEGDEDTGSSSRNNNKKRSYNIAQEVNWIQDNICLAFKNTTYPFGQWECQHGIGHGIIQNQRIYYQNIALEKARKVCEEGFGPPLNDIINANTAPSNIASALPILYNRKQATGACRNGVWMDYWVYHGMNTIDMDMDVNDGDDEEDTAMTDDNTSNNNPLDICSQGVDHAESDVCKLYAPTAFLLRHPRQYKQAIQIFCRGGGNNDNDNNHSQDNDLCIEGVGMQAAKENMNDLRQVEKVCLLAGRQSLQQSCFDEALGHHKMFSNNKSLPSYLCNHLKKFQHLCQLRSTD